MSGTDSPSHGHGTMRQTPDDGPTHPKTAASLSNLGTVLADLGELPAARDHHQRALAIYEAQLGPDHPER